MSDDYVSLEHREAQVAELEAEIERLSGELAQVREILGDREDDITRLRAALREIVDRTGSNLARAALEETPTADR